MMERLKMNEQRFIDEYIEENPVRDSDMLVQELVMLDISENNGMDFDSVMDEDFIEYYEAHMNENEPEQAQHT